MSTKIYNVWLTRSGFGKIMSSIQKLRTEVEESAVQDFKASITGLRSLGSEVNQSKPPDQKFYSAMYAAKNILMGYASLNPTCSAVVYSYPYAGAYKLNNTMLVQLFGVDRTLIKPFVRSIKGEDFHYQNQTDQPEDVSDAEWTARRKVWDKLLAGAGVPSENGLSFDFLNKIGALELVFAELRRSLPPDNQPSQDGKPWSEWGPRAYGIYRASDAERAWKRGNEAWARFEEKLMHECMEPFDGTEHSLSSANL